MKKLLIYGLFLICIAACTAQDCNTLPTTFNSYNAAMAAVKAATFSLSESVNTAKSSWIRGANYYSCNRKVGYFILKTDKQSYIYANMPINIWNGFKNASSFGSYYNDKIIDRYELILN